jgi:hypothetical protein
MDKRISTFFGLGLILLGGLALAGNLVFSALGIQVRWWEIWRLWPVTVLSIGLFLALLPLLFRGNRGLGALFIPGIPILATGVILFIASMFHIWWVWEFLWPWEVLGLAIGFALAAFWMRTPFLGIPAIIIGLNGLVLQFCAVTGLWESWAILWAIEPLAVGLSLMLVSVTRRAPGLMAVGLTFCGFAAVAFVGMSTLMITGWWVFRLIGPLLMIFIGLILLLANLLRRPAASTPIAGEGAA